jgi:cytochrome P450
MNAMPGVWNLAFTPHKKEHGRRRGIIGQGFTDAAMREADPYVKEHVMNLCDRLLEAHEDLSSTSIDPSAQVTRGWASPKNVSNWSQ